MVLMLLPGGICIGESDIINNGDGTFSMENGIFLRHYEGYPEDSQKFLSVLDACYSMIGAYSEIIDPYVNGDKPFDDSQWDVIDTEVRYMSGFACSWIMQNDVPAGLAEHGDEIFFAAYQLMIANDLLMTAFRIEDTQTAALASYYYGLADAGLEWWKR